MPADPQYKGTLPDSQTSWPHVQATLNKVGLSYQQAQAALMEKDLYVGPTDRLPEAVVLDAVAFAGLEPERLERL